MEHWWSEDRDSFCILVCDEADGHVTHVSLTPEEAEALRMKIAEGPKRLGSTRPSIRGK
jgi:hypothetical protein